MADVIYDSLIDDVARNNVDLDTDTFKAMLVTSAYVPNRATHTRRSDITNEVVGTGYVAGGNAVAVTVTKDTGLHKVTAAFANYNLPGAALTARALVIYKSRGGLASADELVAYCDFGGDKTASGGTFAVTFGTPLTFQGP
jgi:hypothetical protein